MSKEEDAFLGGQVVDEKEQERLNKLAMEADRQRIEHEKRQINKLKNDIVRKESYIEQQHGLVSSSGKNWPICCPIIEFNFNLVEGPGLKKGYLWFYYFFFYVFMVVFFFNHICSYLSLGLPTEKFSVGGKIRFVLISLAIFLIAIPLHFGHVFLTYWNLKQGKAYNYVILILTNILPWFACFMGMLGFNDLGFSGFYASGALYNGWFPFAFYLVAGLLWLVFWVIFLLIGIGIIVMWRMEVMHTRDMYSPSGNYENENLMGN